jgi:hypothetical protein
VIRREAAKRVPETFIGMRKPSSIFSAGCSRMSFYQILLLVYNFENIDFRQFIRPKWWFLFYQSGSRAL